LSWSFQLKGVFFLRRGVSVGDAGHELAASTISDAVAPSPGAKGERPVLKYIDFKFRKFKL
jgi:hypothetical protein